VEADYVVRAGTKQCLNDSTQYQTPDPWKPEVTGTDMKRRMRNLEERGLYDELLSREKRGVVLGFMAGIVAGTVFGVYNTVQINKIWREIDKVNQNIIAFEQSLTEIHKDMGALQEDMHAYILKDIMDNSFDSGVLLARLRIHYTELVGRVNRMFDVMQEAQHHRLSTSYLDEDTLKSVYMQAKVRAKSVNHYVVVRQPSDLFQIEASYAYDGKGACLILHIPIAPPDSTMRLYRLHPFPLPFTNDTFLFPEVRDDLLAISNSNNRYTLQLSSVELLGCDRMGKTYLCERNGLLYKVPEDTCLGALYHQRYEEARSICSFHIEPAREYVRQLKENWYLVYAVEPITIPLVCINDTYSELHLKAGPSKFHLKAGCIADMPRHCLLSDLSILIPRDYIQFDMDWDPQSFLLEVRDYVIPEFEKLRKYGQSRLPLSQLQTVVAGIRENPASWFHYLHFSGNSAAFLVLMVVSLLGLIFCIRRRSHRNRLRQEKAIADAVRTALNGMPTSSHPPTYIANPQSYPPTIINYAPYDPPPPELLPLTRHPSCGNMTSVSYVTGTKTPPPPPLVNI